MLTALALLLLQAAPSPAAAPPVPVATTPAAHIAKLDSLLAAREYLALGQAVGRPPSRDVVWPTLDWLLARTKAGSTSFVSLLYAQALWAVSEGAPKNERMPLRETAVMALVYTYGAVTIDGTRCGDRTAPAHRLEQLATLLPGFSEFVRALPEERRALIRHGALLLDASTAAARDATGDAAFLCVGGMEEMTYNLERGTAREVPTPPGSIGRTVITSGDGKYRPSLRPKTEWRPAATAARAQLPATIDKLLDLPTAPSAR